MVYPTAPADFATGYGTLCDMVRQNACQRTTDSMSQPTKPSDTGDQSVDTRLVTSGRDPRFSHGFVNTPVMHGSTILYASADDLRHERSQFSYGREGTATTVTIQSA